MLKYPYASYEGVIPVDVCERIISQGKTTVSEATVRDDSQKAVRKSSTAWLTIAWLFHLVNPSLQAANNDAGWAYEFDLFEPLQFTVYEPGGHYGYHVDCGTDIHSAYPKETTTDEKMIGKIRKLSMTLNLTDPNTYTGGNLEFDVDMAQATMSSGEPRKFWSGQPDCRQQGTIVVFPSYMRHQVTPVQSGTRYSLVAWALGKPFQ